jgi:hypothetical protein
MRITPEVIASILDAQGVAADPARSKSHAAFSAMVLEPSAAAFRELPFEQEPAAFTLELGKAAP